MEGLAVLGWQQALQVSPNLNDYSVISVITRPSEPPEHDTLNSNCNLYNKLTLGWWMSDNVCCHEPAMLTSFQKKLNKVKPTT